MPSSFRLIQSLRAINFSPKEANVYVALLELGKGTVSQIARKAEINRTTGYDILDSLVSRGLASISGKEPKEEYVAESPDKVVQMVKREIAKSEEYLQSAASLIPELKSIHNVRRRPTVKFYEGKGGLIQVYEDTLTSREEIRGYGGVEDMRAALPEYFLTYMDRRAAKNISIKAIFADTPKARELAEFDKVQLRETALVPADKYYFSPEINIYDDKIMIASWREKLGIIIESNEIADAMKKIFELSWAEAKRLNSKQATKADL